VGTETQRIEVRGLEVEIVRKNIKNLHLGVYPPNGRVRVAAPTRLNDDAVRLAVIGRLSWVRRQRAKFEQQERQSEREMVSGETHYVRGRRYRLSVIESFSSPSIGFKSNGRLEVAVRPGTSKGDRNELLQRWYRKLLRGQIEELLPKWETVTGVSVAECRIREMKTRWGSCNPEARRLWLNLELAKKPAACIEYVLVHEMVHLLERRHTDRFRSYMDRFLPQWRHYRAQLNQAPLSHENWTY
jgi:predicted metal-dependent hydrolase